MITPILETNRILLRPLKISDAEAIFDNWATDPDVTKYLRWNTHQSIDVTIGWLTFEEENIGNDNSYQWAFVKKENNEIFGSGGLSYNEEHKMLELGYVIMKKYWNQGLTTEAAGAFIDFAVKELNQSKFFAMHAKENPASGKVMEKIGFVYQKDGEYSSFDGKRIFESKEYVLIADSIK